MADEGDYETPNPGNPAGFIAYHLQIGSSARESLAAWRELGGTSGNQAWYRLVGQVQDTLNRTEQAAALEPGVLPSESDYGEWAAGPGGKYAYQIGVTATDLDTGLDTTSQYTVMSDVPLTPDEATAAAQDEYGLDENAAKYGQEVTGAFVIHLWKTVPFAV